MSNTFLQDQKVHLDLTADENIADIAGSLKGTRIQFLQASNIDAVDYFLQLFDESATVVPGTSVPVLSFIIPKGDGTNHGLLFVDAVNIVFTNKVQYAITTTADGAVGPSTPLVLNALYV